MIASFRCPETQRLFSDQPSKRFRAISRAARRKLEMIHSAHTLQDMRSPPGNHLELLKGDRAGQHSVRINDQFKPLGISQSRLARDLSVPVRRVNDIVQGKRAITPDTALRLAVYFNMTPEFWMNLQSHYDLKVAKRNLLPKIARSIRPAEKRAA